MRCHTTETMEYAPAAVSTSQVTAVDVTVVSPCATERR